MHSLSAEISHRFAPASLCQLEVKVNATANEESQALMAIQDGSLASLVDSQKKTSGPPLTNRRQRSWAASLSLDGAMAERER